MVKILLDPDKIKELKSVFNSELYNMIRKKHHSNKLKREIHSFNQLCAIMDRMEDIVYYLNNLELNKDNCMRTAFDFYDFMNQASVLLDCIQNLLKIFNIEDNSRSECFAYVAECNGNGTDWDYFKYLRSLCSVHPEMTSKYRNKFQTDGECCPYVVWTSEIFKDGSDLHALVYQADEPASQKIIKIHMN